MISCQLHDYVEIACMYRLPVLLKLKNGLHFDGVATDIQRDDKGQECLLLADKSNNVHSILLAELTQMQANINNPHFDHVDFDG